MNVGDQRFCPVALFASDVIVICGNRNAPDVCEARVSRPWGPPASSRQYHSANTRRFASQIDEAESRRAFGDSRREGNAVTNRIRAATSSNVTTAVVATPNQRSIVW